MKEERGRQYGERKLGGRTGRGRGWEYGRVKSKREIYETERTRILRYRVMTKKSAYLP